jgi:hypothetical protein
MTKQHDGMCGNSRTLQKKPRPCVGAACISLCLILLVQTAHDTRFLILDPSFVSRRPQAQRRSQSPNWNFTAFGQVVDLASMPAITKNVLGYRLGSA